MKKTLYIVLAIVLLSAFLGGCIYDQQGKYVLLVVPHSIMELVPGGIDEILALGPDGFDCCAEQGFYLVAMGSGSGDEGTLGDVYCQWYRDGQPLGGRSRSIEAVAAFYPLLPGGLSDLISYEFPDPLFTPGTYAVELFEGPETTTVLARLSIVVPSCGEGSTRTDVSVVIYGGWDGIPVKAYVGGTEQETLYTARDSSGEPAVLWTFYPPAGEAWSVTIEPQTPPGMDPARWQYRLLRIEGPTPEQVVENPAGSGASITSAGQYKLHFQLVDMGPQTGQ